MSDLADARRAGSFAAALEEAGYAGGARDVLRIACLCIRDEFLCFADLAGLPDANLSRILREGLPQADITFLNDIAIPAAEVKVALAEKNVKLVRSGGEPVTAASNVNTKRRRVSSDICKSIETIESAAVNEAIAVSQRALPWKGPLAEIKQLDLTPLDQVACSKWVEESRTKEIIGSCPKSIPSVLSGLRCWCAFASKVLNCEGRELPPSADGLVAWSEMFRCGRT